MWLRDGLLLVGKSSHDVLWLCSHDVLWLREGLLLLVQAIDKFVRQVLEETLVHTRQVLVSPETLVRLHTRQVLVSPETLVRLHIHNRHLVSPETLVRLHIHNRHV